MFNCRLVISYHISLLCSNKNISDVKDVRSIHKVRFQPFLRVFKDRLFVQLVTDANLRFGLCSKFWNSGISRLSVLIPLDPTDWCPISLAKDEAQALQLLSQHTNFTQSKYTFCWHNLRSVRGILCLQSPAKTVLPFIYSSGTYQKKFKIQMPFFGFFKLYSQIFQSAFNTSLHSKQNWFAKL